jgi:acyl dehydratase
VAGTLLRVALPSIPVVNQLPGIRKTGGDLSSLHEVRTATVSREHVDAYAAVCGFPVKDTAPLTFPHVLAFPLHLAVLASPQFPFPAMGTIHVANRITAHRPVEVGETLQLEVHAGPLVAHPKGAAVDFLATATVDQETVWESASTYLRRGAVVSTGSTGGTTDETTMHVVPGRITWRLPGDLGRRYAAVSGDRNPIHLYPLTAKALGFPRQIAHGMWSLARCVAALENRLPGAVTVEASFRKPILLPGTVAFGQDAVHDAPGDVLAFALTSPKTGAPHLVGRAHRP